MQYNDDMQQELNLLVKFPDSSLDGLKVHHSAGEQVIQAARRLHNKGLITQDDGGYLTDLGREAFEAATLLHGLMTPH